MTVGVRNHRGEHAGDATDTSGSTYPVALGCGVLGAAGGTFAAGAVVPAAVLAVLGTLVLGTLVVGAVENGGR
ncbi:MAG: hypothetical protein A07HB70_02009 [uncultured archaeon A07HB70]|nr:MAG: hypothetical protein A07HB70_02009 [uncultured archaeon A07HB70]